MKIYKIIISISCVYATIVSMEGSSQSRTISEYPATINVFFKTNTPNVLEEKLVPRSDLSQFSAFSNMLGGLPDDENDPENNKFEVDATYEDFEHTIATVAAFTEQKNQPLSNTPGKLLRAIEIGDKFGLKNQESLTAIKENFEQSANTLESSAERERFILQSYNSPADTLIPCDTSLIRKKLCAAAYQDMVQNQNASVTWNNLQYSKEFIFNRDETLLATPNKKVKHRQNLGCSYYDYPFCVFDIATKKFLYDLWDAIPGSTWGYKLIPDPKSDGFISIHNSTIQKNLTAIKKWDARTGKIESCIEFDDKSFEGESLVFAYHQTSEDGCDEKTEEDSFSGQYNLSCTKKIALSANGKRLASYDSTTPRNITIWDMKTKKKLSHRSVDSFLNNITDIEFIPKTNMIIVFGPTHKTLLNIENWKYYDFSTGPASSYELYNNTMVHSDHNQKEIEIVDLKTNKLKKTIEFDEHFKFLAISPDNNMLVTTDEGIRHEKGYSNLTVWDISGEKKRLINNIRSTKSRYTAIFSNQGKYLYTLGKNVYLYDPTSLFEEIKNNMGFAQQFLALSMIRKKLKYEYKTIEEKESDGIIEQIPDELSDISPELYPIYESMPESIKKAIANYSKTSTPAETTSMCQVS